MAYKTITKSRKSGQQRKPARKDALATIKIPALYPDQSALLLQITEYEQVVAHHTKGKDAPAQLPRKATRGVLVDLTGDDVQKLKDVAKALRTLADLMAGQNDPTDETSAESLWHLMNPHVEALNELSKLINSAYWEALAELTTEREGGVQ